MGFVMKIKGWVEFEDFTAEIEEIG
jgi:hypothetical protein